MLTAEFTILGIPCLGLKWRPGIQEPRGFFLPDCDGQSGKDRYWNAIVANSGQESACGWCNDRWGLSWQITRRALTDEGVRPETVRQKHASEAMMTMKKIDIASIEAARRGWRDRKSTRLNSSH